MRGVFIPFFFLSSLLPLLSTGKIDDDLKKSINLANRVAPLQTDLRDLSFYLAQSAKQGKFVLLYCRFRTVPDSNQLRSASAIIQDNIQQDVYSVLFQKQIEETNLALLGIKEWGTADAEDKLSTWFLNRSQSDSLPQKLLISVSKNMKKEALEKLLLPYRAQLAAVQPWEKDDIWAMELPGNFIHQLAAESFVRFLQPEFKPQALNWEAIGFTNSQGAHQPLSLGGYNLHGEGVTIGVGDNSDPDHIDYVDRVHSFNPILSTDHGFHTTGTVGGNGIRDEKMKGYASKSNLISDYFSQIVTNGATYHKDFKMMISSNSYGNVLGNCAYAGTYDLYAQFTDKQMRDNPKLLHVFAAANDGEMTCSPYPKGYATVTSSYATAKNVLTVGAMGKTIQWEAAYSSTGPVKDGRLKPEIIAVGTALYSTVLNNDYLPSSGTSMACPNVGGASGLLYQRYRQLNSNRDPGSALVKLLLMNGATDVGNPGPDFKHGFGLMNIGHSLKMMDNEQHFTNTINTGQEQTFTFTVPANTNQAKVMLYWHDVAVAPSSTSVLVNDLDLTVLTPGAVEVSPLVLDPSPSKVSDIAVPGRDHKNNVEQVVLNNPQSGTYTIKVSGYSVPEINQEYYVAYDFIQEGVTIHYPFGGEALNANDSMIIYWEAPLGTNSFAISYSIDNGANWNIISNNVASDLRYYTWYMPNTIASNQCMIKIVRNNTAYQSQSKAFTIVGRPVAELSPLAEQCPGNIKITWNAIKGVGSYKLYKKNGAEMEEVATTNATNYIFKNLSADAVYWVAVAPVVNGSAGMRSVALSCLPNSGDCQGMAPGDLSLTRIILPPGGRTFTSGALSDAEPLKVWVRNLDGQSAGNYRIAYKVNNGAWISQIFKDAISPGGNRQFTLGNLDLAAVGNYHIVVAVSNIALTDPVRANDTLTIDIKQLSNPVMNLSAGYYEGFENVNNLEAIGSTIFGIDGADKWDFSQSKPKGRIRSFVSSAINIQGNKSMSMDNAYNQVNDIEGSSYNTLTATFNLSSYNTTNWEVRCQFDYLLHGYPKFDTGNYAWVRGSDIEPWLPLSPYNIDTNKMGEVYHSGSLSLTDILVAGGQTFSSSTQIRFTQYDTSRIAAPDFGNGFTMDDFGLYLVTDDVQLIAVDSVYQYNCGLSSQVPMRIKVANGVNNTVHNIQVFYKLDNQIVVAGLIDSIQGKDTVQYTFDQPMDLSAKGFFNLSAWIYVATDTYRFNDSLTNYKVRNQPVLTTFPYFENFEQNDGFFYADGNNNSWAYGTPSSPHIDHAASGTKAWKTNLKGNYNRLETSFLYSPCFDISQLHKPTLSFSMASDIEVPDENVFDLAYVEYSHDGRTWSRLGMAGAGTNWYTNDSAQAWTDRAETYWHVATIPLPKDEPIVSFRFVLKSDQGAEFEGMAIDDIHIYDLENPIFDQERFPEAVSQSVGAGQIVSYTSGNDIGVALLNTTASALNNVLVQDYKHSVFINEDSTQYFLPKNFTIQSTQTPGDSVVVRFYIPDQAMRQVREDSICYSCSKPVEVYQLGITKYDDPDNTKENNTLVDNTNGTYNFIPKEKITWIPYDIGYYAETRMKSFSEFWFNDGGPTHNQPLPNRLFTFSATHYGSRYAKLDWLAPLNAATKSYELQRSDGTFEFKTVHTINAFGPDGQSYSYIDTPMLNGSKVYYRVKYTMLNGTSYLSLIRSLSWSGEASLFTIYPNPVRNGVLNMEWFKGSGDGLQWRLFNVVGQEVKQGTIEDNAFSGTRSLDMHHMGIPAGVYLLKVISGMDRWEFKIVYQ